MSHPDQERIWLAQANKPSKDQTYLNPDALYNFFSSANAGKVFNRRAKSATPRLSYFNGATSKTRNHAYGHHPSWETPNLSVGVPRDPAPTPATSRPASSRSGYSSARSINKSFSSPTALYLGTQRGRCKSAPPTKYVPRRPQTASTRRGSGVSTLRGAPQRAWQIRTSSASTHRSLLSPKEVQKRQKERCQSAPLPYDFSSVELVTEVPRNPTDYEKLKAMTKPLTCMPNIVQNAVSHSGLRHCCSAFNTRPKTAPDTRHSQFWPVARPSVYKRGHVPQYFHFVKPAHISGQSPTNQTSGYATQSETDEEPPLEEEDLDEMVLFEESFVMPATPTEPSISDQYDPSDADANDVAVMDDMVERYLASTEPGIHEDDEWDNQLLLPEPVPILADEKDADSISEFQEPELEVIIRHVKSPSPEPENPSGPVEPEKPAEQAEPVEEPKEEESKEEEEDVIEPARVEEPVTEVTEEPIPTPVEAPAEKEPEIIEKEPEKDPTPEPPKQNPVVISSPEPKVKFLDSVTISSYKPPEPKPAPKEPPKPILKPSKPLSPAPVVQPVKTEPPKKPKEKPVFERREADIRPPYKQQPPKQPPKVEDEEKKEEKAEVEKEPDPAPPQPLEPERLPDPEFVRAPGAYKMYQPIDLLEYGLEQARHSRAAKKSTSNMPQGTQSGYHQMLPESSLVINAIMDEERRKREGIKPWLQGRLALSKQTSRFELPMDIRLLESMSAMDYLTQYCIISTRRKALYKHVFQKVDKDRDGVISFRELDKGLKEVHVDSIDTSQVKQIAEMVDADDKTKFNMKQFSAIAAFSERILFADFVTEETKGINNTKEIIEEADFCSLKWKLDGFKVSSRVRKILEAL